MHYLNVWIVAMVAAVACLGFFFLLTRRVYPQILRILLRCLGAVWLLLPAPVPMYPGYYAPAFVVLVFEGLLQAEGSPGLSLRILGFGSVAVVVLVTVWYFVFGRKRLQAAPEESST